MVAAPAAAANAGVCGGVPAVGLVAAPHDRRSGAPLREPGRLVVVVVPVAAISVVPTVAVPIRGVSVEVDGLSGRDVRIRWVVVIGARRVAIGGISARRIVGTGNAHGAARA